MVNNDNVMLNKNKKVEYSSNIIFDKNKELTQENKIKIEEIVKKVVVEYSETLKLLGKE